MSWQETLNEHFDFSGSDTSIELYPSVSEQDIIRGEQQLDVRFPQDLKELLAETNGVGLRLRLDQPPDEMLIGYLIWPLERIIADNITFRTNSQITSVNMPFDGLLFFSDAGNGDLFGFAIWNHANSVDRIYRWDHEDDSRSCIAHSLKDFLQFMSK
jgi:hypothetical protein